MVRVLHVFGGLGTGGTESLIMNWYRNIDRGKVQFDFLVRSFDDNYAGEIKMMGGRIYYTSSFPRHFIKNYIETKNILKQKEWDIIHVHGNAAMYILPLKLAKDFGYKCRIMHSHSVKAKKNLFSIVHEINKKRMIKYTTHRLACSEAAGKWMFGNSQFEIVRNAISIDQYQYDQKAREEIRKKYHLEDKLVIGHVGRFASPKNHLFLLETFKRIITQKPDSVLMLVGAGELEDSIKSKVEEFGISDFVLFMGRRNDIGQVMSSMDLFVLPSIYEGLGNVLIEAQVNGLVCVVSEEAYNNEVQLFDSLSKLSLNKGAMIWADYILEKSKFLPERKIACEVLADTGYDIKTEVVRLEELYLQEEVGK